LTVLKPWIKRSKKKAGCSLLIVLMLFSILPSGAWAETAPADPVIGAGEAVLPSIESVLSKKYLLPNAAQ
jgi:hypothetical protein